MKKFFVNSFIIAALALSAAFMFSCGGGGEMRVKNVVIELIIDV